MKKLIIIIFFLFYTGMAFATDYYVDADASGANNGTSKTDAWESFADINWATVDSGNGKLFVCGTHREILTPTASGEDGVPIQIVSCTTANGASAGDPGIILLSESISSWTHQGDNVYYATATNNRANGMIYSGARAKYYIYYTAAGYTYDPNATGVDTNTDGVVDDTSGMASEFFYSKYGTTRVNFKTTGGSPGTVEVGAIAHGILIDSLSYITVDGLTITGPGASNADEHGIKIESSSNITIQNSTISHLYGEAIGINLSTTGIVVDNVTIDDCKTGFYFTSGASSCASEGAAGIIMNSTITNIGSVASDWGDRGFVSINASDCLLIKDNSFTTQGWTDMDKSIDAGITACCLADNIVIRRNTFKDVALGAIQFSGEAAEPGNTTFEASYNVIDGWGVYPPKSGVSYSDKPNGIKIGGAASGSSMQDVKVYNNLFINGPLELAYGAYGLLIANNPITNIEVKNNTFYENTGCSYEIYNKATVQGGTWDIDNNVIYRTSGNGVRWYADMYGYNEIGNWEAAESEVGSNNFNPNDTAETPGLTNAGGGDYTLAVGSVCINAGEDVSLTTDIAGNTIVGLPDIGAYEFDAVPANAIQGVDIQ